MRTAGEEGLITRETICYSNCKSKRVDFKHTSIVIHSSFGPKRKNTFFFCSIVVRQSKGDWKRLQCLGIEMTGSVKSSADRLKKKTTPFQITQEEVAINTTLQLSIFGDYSHLPISLSSVQQTDYCPDKHNHSQCSFTEHLSVGNNLKKKYSAEHLFVLNRQLSASYY